MDQLQALFINHPHICTDTRQICPGCLFFALTGDRFDGNMFAGEALKKGAAYAVVDNPQVVADSRYLLVPDVLQALQELAAWHRHRYNIPVVALTGSNGKTTTKELIRAVLSVRYRVTATEGNLNNHIGVPLSILKMDRNTDILILEMGTSHAGEIALLTNISHPTAGLITNVGGAHLEGLGSPEGIKQEKGALYDYLQLHNGTLFCHANDSLLVSMLEERQIKKNVLYYGSRSQDSRAAGQPDGVSELPRVWSELQEGLLVVRVAGYPEMKTHLTGLYNIPNILAALAVAEYFGVEREQAAAAVAGYVPSNNRSQWVRTSKNVLIADAYNANPVSMKLALENLVSIPGYSKCAVLGDMLELGTFAEQAHTDMVRRVETLELESVFWVGPLFTRAVEKEKAKGICFSNTEELIEYLTGYPLSGKIILVKGSNGIGLSRLIASGVC